MFLAIVTGSRLKARSKTIHEHVCSTKHHTITHVSQTHTHEPHEQRVPKNHSYPYIPKCTTCVLCELIYEKCTKPNESTKVNCDFLISCLRTIPSDDGIFTEMGFYHNNTHTTRDPIKVKERYFTRLHILILTRSSHIYIFICNVTIARDCTACACLFCMIRNLNL